MPGAEPVTTAREDSPARDTILDAAASEFAEHGFAGARIDEIARRAGVNKAMLYYYVGDKASLYAAVLMRNFDRVDEGLEKASVTDGSVRWRLDAVIAALSAVVQEVPDHPRIVLREIASGGVHLPPEVVARFAHVFEVVGSLLAEGVRTKEFRPLDPLFTHLTLVGAVVFLHASAPIRARLAELGPELELPEPNADVASFLSNMLLDGLATRNRSGDTR
jgi:TetR/AcrR family transcriptional regulator